MGYDDHDESRDREKKRRRRARWQGLLLGLIGTAALGGAFIAGDHMGPRSAPQEIRLTLEAPDPLRIELGTAYLAKAAATNDVPECPPELAKQLGALQDQVDLADMRNKITSWYESLPSAQRDRFVAIQETAGNNVSLMKFLAGCL